MALEPFWTACRVKEISKMAPAAKDKPLESHPGVVRSQLPNGFKIVYLENEYPNDRLLSAPIPGAFYHILSARRIPCCWVWWKGGLWTDRTKCIRTSPFGPCPYPCRVKRPTGTRQVPSCSRRDAPDGTLVILPTEYKHRGCVGVLCQMQRCSYVVIRSIVPEPDSALGSRSLDR